MGLPFDPPTAVGSSPFRIQLTYWWRHHRLARLAQPRLFTEWVQHRKLYDRDPRLPRLADKLHAKDFVADQLGPDWVTPTLWRGVTLPAEPAWEFPYVVKSRHGCGHTIVVHDLAGHKQAVRQSRRWMRRSYGGWLDEWLYGQIERGLLVEPFIGEAPTLPVDYKVFVFGGEARFVQVHLDRAGRHRWIVLDRQWQRVSEASSDPDPAPPAELSVMLRAAERLGAGFCFVRADFYQVDGKARFGEMTFYPGSGLEPVQPSRLDLQMGLLWAAALPAWLEPASRMVA
ncbi:hypothetical protein G7078_10315 [Sphingomonas sinipercae]|uniref:Polysaccharide biosynthesis protein n=1 Tax=Sphingomonas sinipercae TaxID=2714944 RepID=A0A6G7ZQB5_9SPHN|nr:ATP-grasp fold amidoligase family protein [Sphingomonas sinipercae]QIL03133.1 hypothetical protein G7078_10315 [Sphingomonas sinipercae]